MEANFHIFVHRNENYLHLKLCGNFDTKAASSLLAILKNKDLNKSQIFIHTSSLNEVDPKGTTLFREQCRVLCGNSTHLIFTGDNALCLAPRVDMQVRSSKAAGL